MPRTAAVALLALTALAGCATSDHAVRPRPVVVATAQDRAALLDQVKSLAGTWEMADDQGQKQVGAVFAVSSNGSVVREIMFPGAQHEMTNIYHMDGPTLLLTHYCAVGNQPRMRARPGEPGIIAFRFDGVSNYTGGNQTYMGEMVLTIKDADHIRQDWTSLKNGERQETTSFELSRKR